MASKVPRGRSNTRLVPGHPWDAVLVDHARDVGRITRRGSKKYVVVLVGLEKVAAGWLPSVEVRGTFLKRLVDIQTPDPTARLQLRSVTDP